MRIPFNELCQTLARCLMLRGFSESRAARCAYIFAENSLVGVASHGLNRFPRFLEWIDHGWVNPAASPECISTHGGIERWDGNLGPGPLNAQQCMERAMTLSESAGIGSVAVRNTNHWMRAGTYAWQAAEAGYLAVCFTNTEPNLPPWGSDTPKLGNNPIAIAVPRKNGHHVLYDGAMSQFSYGSLEQAGKSRETLPVPGGFTTSGELTSNPSEILRSQRALPIGFWKGSGLALLLDLLATVLTSGKSTRQLGQQKAEYGVSQVFLAFDRSLVDAGSLHAIEDTLVDLHSAQDSEGRSVTYPGERQFQCRTENLKQGVPVNPGTWKLVLNLLI